MLSVKNSSKKKLKILIIFSTILLFGLTGWAQLSCYPMITGGVLPKFCNNIESKLKIIKDPRTHGDTLLVLASNPESDESVLRTLTSFLNSPKVANNPKVLQRALAFNPKTPVDALDTFVKSEDVGILENIAKRSNATPELLRKIVDNPHSNTKAVQKALVENPHTPEDVLQKLANNSKELEILWRIARLKQVSANSLREIANNPTASDIKIQRVLAVNPKTPEDVLQKMADSRDTRVLSYVINNQNSSTLVLERVGENNIIWESHNIGLQRSLAEKENISLKLIERLASSNDRKILETFYYDNPAVSLDLKEQYRRQLGIIFSNDENDENNKYLKEDPLPPIIPDEPFDDNSPENKCIDKHIRNNAIGGAAAVVGFLFGGPTGAVIAYGAMTGSLETLTNFSECQF
ncbi:MAG: hypothetical protein AAFQ80_23220 [Cyanobacteria bacterium J06621_8]